MKQIDRLLRMARKASGASGKFLCASVDYDERIKKFCAAGSICNSKDAGPGEQFGEEFDTLKEALEYVDALVAKYQAADHVTFIIDDLTFPEGE